MNFSTLILKNRKTAEKDLQDAVADNKSTDGLFPLALLRDKITKDKQWWKIFGRKHLSEEKK